MEKNNENTFGKNFDYRLCGACKGRQYCGRKCIILQKFSQSMPSKKTHFSGSSPPEVFVGRHDYPMVFTGILAPQEYGNTEQYSMPEIWHKNNAGITDILSYRSKLVYSRFKSNVKDASKEKRFLSVMQEIAMSSNAVSTEFFLKKPAHFEMHLDRHVPIIGNPAPLKYARLEENPHIEKKVDYLVADNEIKANEAVKELYYSRIEISNIIKILSAGLLGFKVQRKLVPTRWAVTAVDDSVSKIMLERIKTYPETNDFMLFHSDYIGNHYEFLLLPGKFAFEVIEAKISGSVWNPAPNAETFFAQDYEGFSGRKTYAGSVTGAYYANRLALAEYFENIKRQASCFVMRECRPEYWAPCGVGILREASRQAFRNKPERFSTMQEALSAAQKRMVLQASSFTEKSWLLREYGKQKRLSEWLGRS